MKKVLLAIAALAFMAWGCGSDSSDEEITPAYLQAGSDVRPTTWVAPDYSLYELTMSVQVQLGDSLAAYQSRADLMCATVNGDMRAVTQPMSNMGIVYYPLTIAGNGNEQMITLRYYCDRLHRIYTIENWASFDASIAPIGNSGIYRPKFSTK